MLAPGDIIGVKSRDLLLFAYSKLTQQVYGAAADLSPLAEVAVVSTRMLLDFDSSREDARQEECELVAGHMRVVHTIPKHREYMHTGTPSEPILAEAAALAMGSGKIDALAVVFGKVQQGVVDKGTRGELAVRLLCILAYDRAVKTHYGEGSDPAERGYSRPVPLVTFLQALFHENHHAIILQCLPNVHTGATVPTLEDVFHDASVRFSHCGRFGADNRADTFAGLVSVARGMAIQAHHNQVGFDIAIPVVLHRNEKLREDIMTYALIQVRDSLAGAHASIDADVLVVFPERPGPDPDTRPYITISMQLGLAQGEREQVAALQTVPRLAAGAPSTHPRFAIDVRGCSHAVFAVIKAGEADKYAVLYASRGAVDDHDRHNVPENRAQVERQKPEWVRGDSCYDWADVKEMRESLCGTKKDMQEVRLSPARKRLRLEDEDTEVA